MISAYVTDTVIAENLRANLAWNAAKNWEPISDDAQYGKPVCISTLPHAQNTPAVIVGSGPSLDKAAPLLPRFPGAVFCGPSQVRTLDRWSRLPDYIVAIDSHPVVAEQLKGPLYSSTVLLTHQAIDPKVLEFWQWGIRFFRLATDFDQVQQAMYPWLRVRFTARGCTVNAAVQLAAWLGYSPIYLVGVDFGFPEGRLRATDWEPRGAHAYNKVEPRTAYDKKQSVFTDEAEKNSRNGIVEHRGIMTTREMLYYRLLLLAIWKARHPHLWSCSEGILQELPWVSFDEVIEGDYQEGEYPSNDAIDRIVDRELIPAGMFVEANGNITNIEEILDRIDQTRSELSALESQSEKWNHSADGWERS